MLCRCGYRTGVVVPTTRRKPAVLKRLLQKDGRSGRGCDAGTDMWQGRQDVRLGGSTDRLITRAREERESGESDRDIPEHGQSLGQLVFECHLPVSWSSERAPMANVSILRGGRQL